MNDPCGTVTCMGRVAMGFAGLGSDGVNLEVFNVLCY